MPYKAGGKRVAGTNTFHLLTFADIPHHKRKEIIYTKVVCEIPEGKDDENCTRITVGGNLICYPGDSGTNTASLELIKLMLNSVISRKGAWFSCIDIKISTSTCQWKIQNTSVSKLQTFLKSLFWSTGLPEWKTRIGGSTLKFVEAAMGCPKLVF
jgi:hypothetical protein